MSRHLEGLFDDPRVHVLTAPVNEDAVRALSPLEAAAVASASDKRRREFATGRMLAREGLARFFGIEGHDLLNDPQSRAPVWPEGVTGSISHCDTRAWVALADASWGTVGIDGEHRAGLKRELWPMTLREEEIASVSSFDASIRGRRALAHFTAKEAFYKAQHPRTGRYLGFLGARVTLEGGGELCCELLEDTPPLSRGLVARGRWRDEEELVSAVWLPRQS